VFDTCPWNPEHTDRSAYVVQSASGAVAAGCHHNGCGGKDWAALRELFGAAPPLDAAKVRERLNEALAKVKGEGVGALFRDGDLLRDLARLAEEDRAEFACARSAASTAKVRLRDLDAALAPHRQALRRERPPLDRAGCHRVVGGRIVREQQTRDGPVEVPLANWSGRIVEEVVHDDGAERRITLAVEGARADGVPLPRAEVGADQFAWMRWPVSAWGTRAVVLAGASTADHLRAALQLLSGEVPRRVVFEHTGWREVGGRWVYLHGGGALGAAGPAEGAEVDLPEALAGYILPAPPDGDELAAAVRASLRLLGLAPDCITVPLLAAVYRAVLGGSDFALHLSGPSGAFKTELAALAQQHHGAGLDARHLRATGRTPATARRSVAGVTAQLRAGRDGDGGAQGAAALRAAPAGRACQRVRGRPGRGGRAAPHRGGDDAQGGGPCR
jgi:hypothetical protein